MGKEAIKQIEISWKRPTSVLVACCMDCQALNNFLGSNKESESFRIEEMRQIHFQVWIESMAKLSHRIESGLPGQSVVFFVTKTEMSGVEYNFE